MWHALFSFSPHQFSRRERDRAHETRYTSARGARLMMVGSPASPVPPVSPSRLPVHKGMDKGSDGYSGGGGAANNTYTASEGDESLGHHGHDGDETEHGSRGSNEKEGTGGWEDDRFEHNHAHQANHEDHADAGQRDFGEGAEANAGECRYGSYSDAGSDSSAQSMVSIIADVAVAADPDANGGFRFGVGVGKDGGAEGGCDTVQQQKHGGSGSGNNDTGDVDVGGTHRHEHEDGRGGYGYVWA